MKKLFNLKKKVDTHGISSSLATKVTELHTLFKAKEKSFEEMKTSMVRLTSQVTAIF